MQCGRPIVVRLALSVAGRLFITTAICHVPYDINERGTEKCEAGEGAWRAR